MTLDVQQDSYALPGLADLWDYLADPRAAQGVKVLDLLAKNWGTVAGVLRQNSQQLFAKTAAEQNRLLIADRRPLPERLSDLGLLIDEVWAVADRFETTLANIDAILAIESRLLQTAVNAQALEEYIHTFGYAGIALGFVPFHPDDLYRVETFFRHLKVGCRKVLADLRALRPLAQQLADEWQLAVSELDRAYAGLVYEAAVREVENRRRTGGLDAPARGTENLNP